MARNVLAILALGGAALLGLTAAGPAPPPASDYPKIFEAVWSDVDQNFYDPTFHGIDWRATGARYRARLAGVHDDKAFSALMGAMLGELQVSHTHLTPPSASSARGVGVGMDLMTVDGAPTVADLAPLSDGRRTGLRVGDRLEGPPEALYGL